MSEIITTGRSIHTITAEIVGIATSTAQVLFMSAIEMGKRMTEVKSLAAHGEWGEHLKAICQQIDISESTAHNWMRLAREYGDKSNSQALGNLTYTKAVKLLTLPEDEREEFARENDVENMSSRELDQAIKERDAAREMLAVAQEEANSAKQSAADLQKAADSAEALQKEVDRLKAAAEKAAKAEAKAKEQLRKLRDNPKVPAETLEKLAGEAADQARKDFAEKLDAAQKEADAANHAKAEAEAALAAAQAQIAESQKAAKKSDPDVAAFEVALGNFQSQFNQLTGYVLKVTGRNPELGAKMKKLVGDQLGIFMRKVEQ